jgi:hypothetical protein
VLAAPDLVEIALALCTPLEATEALAAGTEGLTLTVLHRVCMAVDVALGVVLEVVLLAGESVPAEEALGEALSLRVVVGLGEMEEEPLGKREALGGALPEGVLEPSSAMVGEATEDGLARRAVPVTDAVRPLSEGSAVGLREARAGVEVGVADLALDAVETREAVSLALPLALCEDASEAVARGEREGLAAEALAEEERGLERVEEGEARREAEGRKEIESVAETTPVKDAAAEAVPWLLGVMPPPCDGEAVPLVCKLCEERKEVEADCEVRGLPEAVTLAENVAVARGLVEDEGDAAGERVFFAPPAPLPDTVGVLETWEVVVRLSRDVPLAEALKQAV